MSLALFQNNVPVSKDGADHMKRFSSEQPFPNTFDEFFDNELFHLSKATASSESLSFIEQYLDEIPTPDDGQLPRVRLGQEAPAQAWRKGLWCMNQQSSSEERVAKTGTAQSQPVFISPLRLDDPGSHAEPNLHLQPEFHSLPEYPPPPSFPIAGLTRSRAMLREQTLSPIPMYGHCSGEGEATEQDAWYQTFPNLSIRPEAEAVRTGMVAKHRRSRDKNPRLIDLHHLSTSPKSSPGPRRYHYPFQPTHQSPDWHDRLDTGPSVVDARDDYVGTPPSAHKTMRAAPFGSRGARQLGMPRTGFDVQYPMGVLSKSACHSPPFVLWSPTSTKQELRPDGVVEPVPLGVTCDQHHHSPYPLSGGLGIRYPSAEEIGRAVPYEPLKDHYLPITLPVEAVASFGAYPIPSSRMDSSYVAYRPPKLAHYRSLSASPLTTTSPASRFAREPSQQYSPSKSDTSRRKSISRSGPVKETAVGSASQEQKRSRSRNRSHSQSRNQSRPRSSSAKARKQSRASSVTATGAVFDFDFVNFTVEDSAKLMADVAPSGSSKTRARREHEAKEKRKRLNAVAISAVKAAGGNVRDLQRRLVS